MSTQLMGIWGFLKYDSTHEMPKVRTIMSDHLRADPDRVPIILCQSLIDDERMFVADPCKPGAIASLCNVARPFLGYRAPEMF